jgi:cellulose synthase/poly-beta-1,6-N-acetylglucosamine synthase-like glycosyltransferase
VVAAQFAAANGMLACVQAKLMVANAAQSFTTRQFALEYCLRYELTLPGLARLGLATPLGGTSNHFRTQVLRQLSGWDALNVTQDADLGMRCSALGYRA